MVRTPTADTPSASPYLVEPENRADFLRSLRSLKTRSASPIKPTVRYLQIVDALFHHRILTAEQIQLLLFTAKNRSGCHRSLKLLSDSHWIDYIEGETENDPYLYQLSTKSIVGNRIIKATYGESEFRRGMYKVGSYPHLIAINDVRVRVETACRDLNFALKEWVTSPPLQQTLQLVPDGYFLIQRQVDGATRSAGHFLELQHSIRAGTALDKKLRSYSDFYYSKQYEQWSGIRGM